MASYPNFGTDISVAKGYAQSAAIVNVGTDEDAIVPGNLTVSGNLVTAGEVFVQGNVLLLGGADTLQGADAGFAVTNFTATGQQLQITGGGPATGNTSVVTIGTAEDQNVVQLGRTVTGAPDPTQAVLLAPATTIKTLSTYDAALGAFSACPATGSLEATAFTPAVTYQGLYAVLVGPGTDGGALAPLYTSGLFYYDGIAWTNGGAGPSIEPGGGGAASVQTGKFSVACQDPPSAALTFLNGSYFGVTAGQVYINLRCLFTPVPGQGPIPPFTIA
jgi:hypothetical protein